MSDLLDKWQRAVKPTLAKDDGATRALPPPEPPAPRASSGQEEGEEKSPTRYRLGSIELRPARGLWSLPTYAQLIDVLFDGKQPSFIALVFLHQLVIVKGRNLGSMVAGLRMRTQWMIEQHDIACPPPKGEPFVEAMEFITEDIPAALAALRSGVSQPPRQPPQTVTGRARALT